MARAALLRLFGIPIRIDASWLIIAALVSWSLARGYFPFTAPGFSPTMYWIMGLLAALLLFSCVLLHELGHALTAQRFGIPVTGITLFIFGGVAQIGRDPHRPSVELVVAAAGPLVSAILAGSCLVLSQQLASQGDSYVISAAILRYLAFINTAIILFNLLPGFPLDGGRIARAIIWMITGSFRTATRIASQLGLLLGLGLFGLGVWSIIKGAWVSGLWYFLLGTFLRNAALASYRDAARN